MKKLKKVIAAMLCASMVLGMTACGDKGGEVTNTEVTQAPVAEGDNSETKPSTNNDSASGKNDEIIIGAWWLQYYDSKSENMEVSSDWVNAQPADTDTEEDKVTKEINRQIAQLKWDNVKKIEERYGVKFYFENLTYAGVVDSINTSILAGSPDCDVYLVDGGMAIPAQMNDMCVDLKTFLPEDHDLFTTKQVVNYYDFGDGRACIFYPVSAVDQISNTYPLAFNKQMLEDNNLEDPRALWERGEWTWDKFIEYCKVLTQDTDGDGQLDQYGYCGFINETFEQLMMSNGANIAAGTTEELSSAATGETLQMVQDMYLTHNICYPYDFEGEPWNSLRNQYTEGNIGFWPTAVWIQNGNGDYTEGSETNLEWDTVYVRWPVGPSGSKETNPGKNNLPSGAFMIPAGVAEPEKVFNVMYDWFNWENGKTDLRDNKAAMNWFYVETAYEVELQEANFEVMRDAGKISTADLWNSVGVGYDLNAIINGTMTPAQFQETYKQQVQDALDTYYGN